MLWTGGDFADWKRRLADNAGKTQYLRFIAPARARLRALVAGDALEEALGPLLDASPPG